MRLLHTLAVVTAAFILQVHANAQKIIFQAPALVAVPDSKPGIDFLRVQSLSHSQNSLRSSLKVSFASDESLAGTDHWYLLRLLNAKQRYELRVCWAAIQPTAFKLNVHTLSDVFDNPYLIQNLDKHITRPDPKSPYAGKAEGEFRQGASYESLLFLHIQAAADYFSPNKTLMLNPPDVDVDIILDPYTASIFPRSLLPTALYLVILVILGTIASSLAWTLLQPSKDKTHVD